MKLMEKGNKVHINNTSRVRNIMGALLIGGIVSFQPVYDVVSAKEETPPLPVPRPNPDPFRGHLAERVYCKMGKFLVPTMERTGTKPYTLILPREVSGMLVKFAKADKWTKILERAIKRFIIMQKDGDLIPDLDEIPTLTKDVVSLIKTMQEDGSISFFIISLNHTGKEIARLFSTNPSNTLDGIPESGILQIGDCEFVKEEGDILEWIQKKFPYFGNKLQDRHGAISVKFKTLKDGSLELKLMLHKDLIKDSEMGHDNLVFMMQAGRNMQIGYRMYLDTKDGNKILTIDYKNPVIRFKYNRAEEQPL